MEQGPGATSATRAVTIVVADDSPSLRALVRITLASQGWNIVEAETAESALAQVRSVKPDLAVFDVTFGDTGPDGLAICAELRADPATAHIPIVILTAHDDNAERKRAEASGASAFIAKPFGPIELMQIVRGLLPIEEPVPLGVYLLEAGAVHPAQLEAALEEQRVLVASGSQKRIGDVLVERGSVSAVDVERALLLQKQARLRNEPHALRVLVVDDHHSIREGLAQLISGDPDLALAGMATNADEALRVLDGLHPDVVLLDNEMPGRNGIEILPDLTSLRPRPRVVMFSLDHAIREEALRRGADAFVAKDAAPSEVLQAIRAPGHEGPETFASPAATAPAAAAVFSREPQMRRAVGLTFIFLVAYVGVFLLLEPVFGASAGAFSVLPVALTGALLGPEAGLIQAALTIVTTFVLWNATGHFIGEPVLEIGSSGIGVVLLVLMGVGAGAMREVGARIDPRRRRVAALADAVESLSGLTRSQLLDAYLDAMRRMLPAHAILLYGKTAGDAALVGASARDVVARNLAPSVSEAMRRGTHRIVDVLTDADRPVPGMSSALIVPITVSGHDVRGAIVLLHRNARRYREEDVAPVRPFATYLWLVLQTAPAEQFAANATVAENG